MSELPLFPGKPETLSDVAGIDRDRGRVASGVSISSIESGKQYGRNRGVRMFIHSS